MSLCSATLYKISMRFTLCEEFSDCYTYHELVLVLRDWMKLTKL